MKQPQHTGKFIVFEGGEGAGKTTQIEAIHRWLTQQLNSAIPIIVTREPGGTQLGQRLRQILLSDVEITLADRTELLLYAADRAQHVEQFIKPHLVKGAVVLCDRYTDSTIAYQGYGRRLDLDLIKQLNQIATGGLESDLTLWLDVAVKVGLERARSRGKLNRLDAAKLEFHQSVRQGYMDLAQAYPQRIIPINANKTQSEVQAQIIKILQPLLTPLLQS
jgi:dTMP kinase